MTNNLKVETGSIAVPVFLSLLKIFLYLSILFESYKITRNIGINSLPGKQSMSNRCKKCNREFLNLYEGICHQCWSKDKSDSAVDQSDEFKTYTCPACETTLFKGNVSKLAMACPRCNHFVKIP
jgi:hypothetical protein